MKILWKEWRQQRMFFFLGCILGLSGMFIFGISMFQIGHNLQPRTTYNGKKIDPVLQFYSPAGNTYDWADPKTAGKMTVTPSRQYWIPYRLCVGQNRIMVLDLSDPQHPKKVFYKVYDWVVDYGYDVGL